MSKKQSISKSEAQNFKYCQQDWNFFIRQYLNVRLDPEQQTIVAAVQHNRRVSVRSGHARGKDFVAANIATTFLYLHGPSKVILIAPTQRQLDQILMPELARLHQNAVVKLGGQVSANRIKTSRPDWYLTAFSTQSYRDEAWAGFHSPHIMVIVSEASGIDQQVFNNLEGLLTGDSRLLLVFNPLRTSGEAYQSARSPLYVHHHLNCLHAPNVTARRIIYPGQVDWDWVNNMVQKNCSLIPNPEDYRHTQNAADSPFQWDGAWYLPNDEFRMRVMGDFPLADSDQLIPLPWIEAAVHSQADIHTALTDTPLYLGVDVAGMGTDKTVLVYRYGNVVTKIQPFPECNLMALAGIILNILNNHRNAVAFIDAIGEGAGVYACLHEKGAKVVSVIFSTGAQDASGRILTDRTRQRQFGNMRAYCWWAVRDALDPQADARLNLPQHPELIQDLSEPRFHFTSNGRIQIEEKDDIRKRLRRSPDFGDALALTFYPIASKKIGFYIEYSPR